MGTDLAPDLSKILHVFFSVRPLCLSHQLMADCRLESIIGLSCWILKYDTEYIDILALKKQWQRDSAAVPLSEQLTAFGS